MALTVFDAANDPFGTPYPFAAPHRGDIEVLVAAQSGTGVLSGCAVTAQVTPDMTVAVAAGQVAVAGVVVDVAAGNVTITTANATNPRYDAVVVDSTGAKSVTAGTAAADPVWGNLGSVSVLAIVYVPANDTAMNSNQICDKRVPPLANTVGGTELGRLMALGY